MPKSRKAPKQVERALDEGAELVIAWGGDGTVQRCIDVLAGSGVPLAIAPAGTANLLATHLEIPQDIEQVVAIALGDSRRTLDVGTINGEHFAVMAGAGFDAEMLKEADGGLKDAVGRVAYLWTGAKQLRATPVKTKIKVDGTTWFDDVSSCVLVGNVGGVFGGVDLFDGAEPDDGLLELGVVTADGLDRLGADARADGARLEREVAVRAGHAGEEDHASRSARRCSTSSTAATATRSRS